MTLKRTKGDSACDNQYQHQEGRVNIMDITQSFVHRLTAYIIGTECCRNTELMKERHKSGSPADMDFYEAMLQHLSQTLSSHVTDIIDIQKRGGIWGVLAKSPSLQNRFYQSYLRFYKECLKGERWEPLQNLNERTSQSPAEYILDGEFKLACEKKLPLTQVRLGIINHDVHNRIFTLIENRMLPLPLIPEDSKRERAHSEQTMKTA